MWLLQKIPRRGKLHLPQTIDKPYTSRIGLLNLSRSAARVRLLLKYNLC